MSKPSDQWFRQPGVYGEDSRATVGPRLRPATSLQHRRLSQQDFIYFIPFLPLAVCPDAPDVLAEYCQASGKELDVTYWKLTRRLVPSLSKRNIETDCVFGLEPEVGLGLMKFCDGVVLEDEKSRSVYRMFTTPHSLIEPAVSLASSAEKLLASRFNVFALNLQSPTHEWQLVEAEPPLDFRVVKTEKKEPALWKIAQAFWRRGSRMRVIELG